MATQIQGKHLDPDINSLPYSSFTTNTISPLILLPQHSNLQASHSPFHFLKMNNKCSSAAFLIGLSVPWHQNLQDNLLPVRNPPKRNQKSINMPSLDTIPPELFREIGSYLAFFDKASLSLTSRKCRALLGPFDCPDYTSWAGYLCINAHCYPSYQQIYVIPDITLYLATSDEFRYREFSRRRNGHAVRQRFEYLENQFRLYYSSFTEQKWFKDPKVGGLRLERPMKPSSSNQALASLKPSPLLSCYFPGLKYPECTLAYFYLTYFVKILDAARCGSKQLEGLKAPRRGVQK